MYAWFLENFVCDVCACVPTPRLVITSGISVMIIIWNPYDWLNKFYSFYMVDVVHIVILLVGVVLELKHTVETNLIKVS